jgi:hypothetical protein
LEDEFVYDEEYCFRCCAEYGTNEPCPECSCDFLDEFEEDEFWEELEEQEYEAWDGGEYEDWEDEEEEL